MSDEANDDDDDKAVDRKTSEDEEQSPRPRKIEPSHMVLVPDMIDLQTFVYPSELLKSMSLLDALKAFEPELLKPLPSELRRIMGKNGGHQNLIDENAKEILQAIQRKAANATEGSSKAKDKINIILVTLKQKETDQISSSNKTTKIRASRSSKSAKAQKLQRQSKLKSKTIFTQTRPKPIVPSASNVGSLLSKVTAAPVVRQEGQTQTVHKGPLAALFDRPNEVVEAIKEGGIIIQRLRVRNGGIAIAGPNGIATAGSGGTAIVGPGGTAITHPKGLSIAGPGARVISVPETSDLRSIALNTNPGEIPPNGTVVAHGPIIHYNHPVPIERL